MKVKELIRLLGFMNRNAVVKIDGNDIKVEYSMNQDGQWTINLITKDTNNTCGDKGIKKDKLVG